MNDNTNKLARWSENEMLEIRLNAPINDSFLKIKETLTRIGVASTRNEKTLFQTCHILFKRNRYYIVHFKEMFLLDGKSSNLSVDDLQRRNKIASLIAQWNMAHIVNPEKYLDQSDLQNIKIVQHKNKDEWELVPKYEIGNKRK